MLFLLEAAVAAFIIIGAAFTLIGSLGLVRLPDFYLRTHGPTKATTLGVGGILIASVLFHSMSTGHYSIHEVLITVFLFITAPVSAHMMVKAAMHLNLSRTPETKNGPWKNQARPTPGEHVDME